MKTQNGKYELDTFYGIHLFMANSHPQELA